MLVCMAQKLKTCFYFDSIWNITGSFRFKLFIISQNVCHCITHEELCMQYYISSHLEGSFLSVHAYGS